jgi:hypothetical protein
VDTSRPYDRTALGTAAAEAPDELRLEERAIVELVLAGEAAPFRRLVERYQRRALSIAFRLVGSRAEAEDLAQESFVDAFEKLALFDPTRRFSAWLFRIVVNNCAAATRSCGCSYPPPHSRRSTASAGLPCGV